MNPKHVREGARGKGPRRTMPKVRPKLQVRVSDHAVVRYLERVLALDIDEIRELIFAEAASAAALGARKHVVGEVTYVMERGVITTILAPEEDPANLLSLAPLVAQLAAQHDP